LPALGCGLIQEEKLNISGMLLFSAQKRVSTNIGEKQTAVVLDDGFTCWLQNRLAVSLLILIIKG
jgi:hypothetical protein